MLKNKNIIKAVNRNVRSSPSKVNLLHRNIRGKKADLAIRDLTFTKQRKLLLDFDQWPEWGG